MNQHQHLQPIHRVLLLTLLAGLAVVSAALLLLGGRASAGPATLWVPGDVFVGVVAPNAGDPAYLVFGNDGTPKGSIPAATGDTGQHAGCAFAPNGDLYTTNADTSVVTVYDGNDPHAVRTTIPTTQLDGGQELESITFAANGDFFVGHADNINHNLARYTAGGTLVRSWSPAAENKGIDWIDLAADQHTMFYTSEGPSLKRYDVTGAGAQLADFALLQSPPAAGANFAFRLLPPGDGTGGLIVAETDLADHRFGGLERVSGAGQIVQSYTIPSGTPGWFALNRDPNGTSFWSATTVSGQVYRFGISTGQVEVGPVDASQGGQINTVRGLCVKGEIVAGEVSPTPTASPVALTATRPPATATSPAVTTTPRPTPTATCQPGGAALTLQIDDGSRESSVGVGSGGTEYAALWLNRFTPPAGAYPLTLQSIQILWPAQAGGNSLTGRQARLLVYQDPAGSGNPAGAALLYQQLVTIGAPDTFQAFPVNVTAAGPGGDLYIGFEDAWAAPGFTPRLYPAALDTHTPLPGRSWLAAMSTGAPPSLTNVGANDVLETSDAAGQPGTWMIRASGSSGAGGCAGCTIQFSDVAPSNPFYNYIHCLACHGIISGYSDGTFRWGNNVTRAQMAKFIANAAGYQDAIPPGQQTFTDVPASNPFWLYVERVYRHGIISGYADGTFRPSADVTRGQTAKFVANAAGYQDTIPPGQQTFTDVPASNPFWLFAERVYAHGVISGYADGTFRPFAAVTRGQAAKFVANAFFPNCAVLLK